MQSLVRSLLALYCQNFGLLRWLVCVSHSDRHTWPAGHTSLDSDEVVGAGLGPEIIFITLIGIYHYHHLAVADRSEIGYAPLPGSLSVFTVPGKITVNRSHRNCMTSSNVCS
jgi:hypothetical protein